MAGWRTHGHLIHGGGKTTVIIRIWISAGGKEDGGPRGPDVGFPGLSERRFAGGGGAPQERWCPRGRRPPGWAPGEGGNPAGRRYCGICPVRSGWVGPRGERDGGGAMSKRVCGPLSSGCRQEQLRSRGVRRRAGRRGGASSGAAGPTESPPSAVAPSKPSLLGLRGLELDLEGRGVTVPSLPRRLLRRHHQLNPRDFLGSTLPPHRPLPKSTNKRRGSPETQKRPAAGLDPSPPPPPGGAGRGGGEGGGGGRLSALRKARPPPLEEPLKSGKNGTTPLRCTYAIRWAAAGRNRRARESPVRRVCGHQTNGSTPPPRVPGMCEGGGHSVPTQIPPHASEERMAAHTST